MNNFEKTTKWGKNTVFFWKSKKNKKSHKCSIKTYWITWEKAIVIATNLTDEIGQEFRDITKEIINFINKEYQLSPKKIMLIEHYPKNSISNKEIYLQVLLTDRRFIRYEIDKKKLVALINKSIV